MKIDLFRKLMTVVLLITALPSSSARAGVLALGLGGGALTVHLVEEIDDEGKIETAVLKGALWGTIIPYIACMTVWIAGAVANGVGALCALSDKATPVSRLDDEFFAHNGYSEQERDHLGKKPHDSPMRSQIETSA